MAVTLSVQGFQGNGAFKTSAHLMGTGFRRFASCAMAIVCVMIHLSAQPHLENQIEQPFQTPAGAIYLNPY